MPLLPIPPAAHAPAALAPDVARMQAEAGSYLELALLYGLRPDLYAGIGKGYDAFFRNEGSQLTLEERELIAYLCSLLTCSIYGERRHRARIEELHVAPNVLKAIDERDLNNQELTHRQRAFLNFARKMAAMPHTIVRQDIDYLRQNGFDDAAILEVGALAAFVTMLNTMADAFKVEFRTAPSEQSILYAR